MKVLVIRGYSISDYYFKGYNQFGDRLFTINIEEARRFKDFSDYCYLLDNCIREFSECKVFMDDVE